MRPARYERFQELLCAVVDLRRVGIVDKSQRIDSRTDVFGVGAVLYELLTGRPPYAASTRTRTAGLARQGKVVAVGQRNDMVPDEVAAICMRCLAGDPGEG